MATNTPALNFVELKDYLERHLDNELQWLLRAASEWHVQHQLQLHVSGYSVQVYALDSAFLHARALFEFFTKSTRSNFYGCDSYHIALLSSLAYSSGWESILHSFIMHTQYRSNPRKLRSFDGTTTKDLNEMPIDFAREVIRLWREFVNGLAACSDVNIQGLAPIADSILNQAIANTNNVFSNPMVKGAVVPITW